MDIQEKVENVQAAVSYGLGGGMSLAAFIAEAGTVAQSLAFIVGLYVILIRALHDTRRYFRGSKNKDK